MNQEVHSNSGQVKPTASLVARTAVIGFVGGILWSAMGVFLYYFSFAEVAPKMFVLRSWLQTGWTDSWLGEVISIFIVGIISIGVAYIYYLILKKWYTMWLGVGFGIVCWLLIFIVFHPIYANIISVYDMNWESIISTLSLFIMYGVFIGYSIAYDFHDSKIRQMQMNRGNKK